MSLVYGILKPDAVSRHLEGEIYRKISRLSGFGFRKRTRLDEEIVKLLYPHNVEKEFFTDYLGYMTHSDSEVFVTSGDGILDRLNDLIGTMVDPEKGTIRHDLQKNDYFPEYLCYQNLIHSPSDEEACRRDLVALKKMGFI